MNRLAETIASCVIAVAWLCVFLASLWMVSQIVFWICIVVTVAMVATLVLGERR